jgi:hypothetical protein
VVEIRANGVDCPLDWRGKNHLHPQSLVAKALPKKQRLDALSEITVVLRSRMLRSCVEVRRLAGAAWRGQWRTLHAPKSRTDDPLTLIEVGEGVLLGALDGEVGFIMVSLAHAEVLHAFLVDIHPPHRVILDDVDSEYGLHDYTCSVSIRHAGRVYWSQSYQHIHYTKTGDSYSAYGPSVAASATQAVFVVKENTLARDGYNAGHPFSYTPSFPWSAAHFSGKLEDICVVDFTIWDEHSQPVWALSRAVVCERLRPIANDYGHEVMGDEELFRVVVAQPETGCLALELLVVPARQTSTVLSVDFRLDLAFIDTKFGTQYAAIKPPKEKLRDRREARGVSKAAVPTRAAEHILDNDGAFAFGYSPPQDEGGFIF